jgi:serine/threonine protein kinase
MDINRLKSNKYIKECIEFTNINDLTQINKGGQSNIFKLEKKDCGIAIVKKYLDKVDIKDIENEINNLKLVNKLIENVCPNFIYMYHYSYEKKYIIVEYCDGDLESLFIKNILNENIFKSILFQLLYGIYAMQTIGIIHNDLKYRNIFYKKTSQEYLYYKIGEDIYKIKTYGYLVLIADFGLSIHVKKNIKEIIKEYYYLPLSNHNSIIIKNILYRNNIKIDNFIITNYLKEFNNVKKEIYSKKIDYKEFSKLYYISLENKYIDYKKLHDKLNNLLIKEKKYITWIENYNDFLENIFVLNMYIPDILNKYFNNNKIKYTTDKVYSI